MPRALYRCLVWMHPPLFRREFASEMLWIYDEAAQIDGVFPLFCDGLVSLARQWFLRSGYWKWAVALLGGLFQVTMCGVLMFRIGQFADRVTLSALENPELVALMRLGAATSVGLLAAVMFLVSWWRRLARRTRV